MQHIALLLCMFFMVGCGGALAGSLTPSDLGGSTWMELTSPHFVVRTDLRSADAIRLLEEFERIHAVFEDVAFPYELKPSGRIRALVLRDRAEYEEFGPPGTSGYYSRGGFEPDAPALVMYGEMSAKTRLIFQHELAHRFVHFYFPGAPRWLNEGLAEYYSTLAIAGGKIYVGRDLPRMILHPGMTWGRMSTPLPWGVVTMVPTGVLPTAQQLVEGESAGFIAREVEAGQRVEAQRARIAHYAAAWAMVHVLKDNADYSRALDNLLVGLSAGVEPGNAWQDAFGGHISFASLDRSLGEFYARRDTQVLRGPFSPGPTHLEAVRKLEPVEMRLLWASARPWTRENLATIHRDLDDALALAPASPEVHRWRARMFRVQELYVSAEMELRTAMDARPDDEQTLYELFRLRDRQAELAPTEESFARVDSVVKALLPRATEAQTLNSLAWYLAHRGRVDEALPLAFRSVKSDFNCFECYDTLAFVLNAKGRVAEAHGMQSLAIGLAPDGFSDAKMLERLQQYRAAAQAGKAR